MSSVTSNIDDELIERLNQLQLRDERLKADMRRVLDEHDHLRAPSPDSPRVSVHECITVEPEAPQKKRSKKRGGKKRRSGYQCFVSKEFSWAKKDLATWKSVPERLITSSRVFCELGRRWQSFSQLDRESWGAAAAGNGPTPPAWRGCEAQLSGALVERHEVLERMLQVSGLPLLTAKRGVAAPAPDWTEEDDQVLDEMKPHGWWREREMTSEEADDLVCSMDGLGNAW